MAALTSGGLCTVCCRATGAYASDTAGVAAYGLDVLLMLPMSFPDKRAALLGAFTSRFALGFFAATIRLPAPPIVTGILVGLLTSLPDAIITKAYGPIIGMGAVGGTIIGVIIGRFGR
jgi:hypothetical protein